MTEGEFQAVFGVRGIINRNLRGSEILEGLQRIIGVHHEKVSTPNWPGLPGETVLGLAAKVEHLNRMELIFTLEEAGLDGHAHLARKRAGSGTPRPFEK